MTESSSHILVIGAGGAGSRLASQAQKTLGFDCLQISGDKADFDSECDNILISTKGVINPSSQLVRSCTVAESGAISQKISGYSSVVIMANLAGKGGASISPIVSRICKDEQKKPVSFAIMPFGFEKNRIFNSGIALKRLRADSECTIILDNDAILNSNPDLSPAECHKITNSAIMYVAGSLKSSEIPGQTSVISTSKDSADLEASLRDSLKMLYANASNDKPVHSVVHVLGGDKIPIGTLDMISSLTGGAFDGNGRVDVTAESSEQSKVVMVSSLAGTRFESYDPLGAIPQKDTLDWDEPECSIDCALDIPQLE